MRNHGKSLVPMGSLLQHLSFDMGLSAVADTVLLPYSIYLENKQGDIKKARFE
jgi:uncharacterized protein YceK